MCDSNMSFNGKITLKLFEKKLTELCGESRELTALNHFEGGEAMTLYYIADCHAGTWQSGEGWLFTNEAIESNITAHTKLREILRKRAGK